MFAALEILPSRGHTSDTLKHILDNRCISSIKNAHLDISAFNFGGNARKLGEAGCLAFCSIMAGIDISLSTRSVNNFLTGRHSGNFASDTIDNQKARSGGISCSV